MPNEAYFEIFLYLFLLVFISPFLGKYIYRLCEAPCKIEMDWKEYCLAVLLFNGVGLIFLLGILVFQSYLPLNPQNLPNVPFWLAFNTAVSFVTNTNWQAYSGEATLSYFSQAVGLTTQNFLSASTGICVLLALARALRNEKNPSLGNFWKDLNRTCLYLLLPMSTILAVLLVHEGVLQNFLPYQKITGLLGGEQILPMGPAASQIAIKQLGTNGGGFFGVNSAHPFENPTPLSNFLQMFAILLIPAALPFTFGKLIGNFKHGVTLFIVMWTLLILSLIPAIYFETQLNPINGFAFLEGKETRFGIGSSVLWGITTTAASNGSVNSMLSSFSPLAGMFCMLNIMLGEVIFGGVGSGLYGMVLFVILTVFIAGLMVGRTPEYLGKKIEADEIKPAVIGVILPSLVILIFSAIACSTEVGLKSLLSKGPHGLSEILYAFTSAAGNNGSAFAGLNANTDFYNILTAIAMLIGRYGVIIPVFIVAGNLAIKKKTPLSLGTFQTEGFLFGGLLISIILIIGALTFFPALCLGPIMEHLLMLKKITF